MHLALYAIISVLLITASARAQAVKATAPASAKPAIEILDFKVGSDYYPMLDEKSAVTGADTSEYPRTEAEKLARRTSRRGALATSDDIREQGKLKTRVVIISDASWVRTVIKNTGDKPIRAIDWDFAFPRFEEGKLALRFPVSSRAMVKPGQQKSFKQQLPPGASKCKVINVKNAKAEEAGAVTGKIFDSVCGRGIQDASQLKQETISITRIEYADGSVWQK